MTVTLILMRHAKSAPDTPQQGDRARPLSPRGRDQAAQIGDWLVMNSYLPDAALVSSAVRTRETWACLAERLSGAPDADFQDHLYHAAPEVMLHSLRNAHGETVLMLGHNPGIAAFAAQLPRAIPEHPRFLDYPPAATLVVQFPAERWADLRPGTGTVISFAVPQDLK